MGVELTLLFGTTLNLIGGRHRARGRIRSELTKAVGVGAKVGLNSRLALPKYAVLGGGDLIRLAYSDSMLPSVVRSSCLRCCMRRVG